MILNQDSWPHAPPHWLATDGTFFVTAATYRKQHHFRSRARLRYLHNLLLSKISEYGLNLEAWAVFSNHYHLVVQTTDGADALAACLKSFHGESAIWLNKEEGFRGRMVWHNFRETRLTFQKSYLARLHYVHENAVRHGLVDVGRMYPWCSAAWFEQHAEVAMVRTVYGFKIDQLSVEDDYEVFKGEGKR